MFDDDGLDDMAAGFIAGVIIWAACVALVVCLRIAAWLFMAGCRHAARYRERARAKRLARAEAQFEELEVLDVTARRSGSTELAEVLVSGGPMKRKKAA